MMKDFKAIVFSVSEGVARIQLNRPDRLNSLNESMLEELLQAISECATNASIKSILLTGSGRGFCVGADLVDANTSSEESKRLEMGLLVKEKMDQLFNPVISNLSELDKPVVVAVNGLAAGGGMGLALAGDVVVAAQSAVFKQVFISQLGIIPDMGCTWIVPRLVGRARALGLALLGDNLSAAQAQEWGLIWGQYPDDQLMMQAQAIALRLANGPSLGISHLKKAFKASEKNTLDEQLDYEAKVQLECCASEDFQEGCLAFSQKRSPIFKGR